METLTRAWAAKFGPSGVRVKATDCYLEAIGLHREIGSRWGIAETLCHLGDVRHAVGDTATARTAWEEALTILDDLHHPDREQIRTKLNDLSAAPPAGAPDERGNCHLPQ